MWLLQPDAQGAHSDFATLTIRGFILAA